MGQLGEAKVWFERSVKISEKLALADATDAQAQRDLIVGHYMMADLYHRLAPPPWPAPRHKLRRPYWLGFAPT